MKKVSHKIILLVLFTIILSSIGGAWLALRGFTSSKEDELLEKTARVVLSLSQLIDSSKELDSPQIKEALASYPLYGVGIVDTASRRILLSNGGLNLSKDEWKALREKISEAAVSSVILENLFISVGKVHNTNFAVVAITPRETVWHLVKENFRSYLALLIFMALFLGFFAAWVARRMVRPIEELTATTELLSEGKWDVPITNDGPDEIGALSRAFRKMSHSLQERENKIRNMNDELALSEKLATLGQFSAGIAHEIKNPLASISTHLQLLERGSEEQKVQDKCKLLLEEVGRANTIINGILGFSRQDRINVSHVKAKSVLERIFHDLVPVAENAKVKMEFDWVGDDVEINIDPEKIRQVFANLMSNSIDALNKKEGILSWRIEARDKLYIHIRDNGPGIPEEHRKKLFDPFFTSKPAGKGTGLGLSVCHGIMKQHGGEITVIPETSGAHFLLSLPVS